MAGQTDLVALLRSRGETLKRLGREWEWKFHDERVTIRGNVWYDQYTQKGGDAVDFFRYFYGEPEEQTAAMLLNRGVTDLEKLPARSPPVKKEEPKELEIPEAHKDMRRVFAYLLNRRGIDRDVLYAFVRKGMVYESADYHNAVFVGFDGDDIPRHAHKRGTGSESNYKGNVSGSQPEYSFHWHGQSERLYLFEAPIDLLSFISMNKNRWQRHSYAACCGVADHVLWQMMKDNPHIEYVYLCLDNDEPGQQAAERIIGKLVEKGIPSEILTPTLKDWNEDLLFTEQEEEPCPTLQL